VETEDETVAKRTLGEPVIVMKTFRAKHPGLDRKWGFAGDPHFWEDVHNGSRKLLLLKIVIKILLRFESKPILFKNKSDDR